MSSIARGPNPGFPFSHLRCDRCGESLGQNYEVSRYHRDPLFRGPSEPIREIPPGQDFVDEALCGRCAGMGTDDLDLPSFRAVLEPVTTPEELRASVVARIQSKLDAANRHLDRLVAMLDIPAIAGCVRKVIEGEPYARVTGIDPGIATGVPVNPAITDIALAARIDGRIYLGINSVDVDDLGLAPPNGRQPLAWFYPEIDRVAHVRGVAQTWDEWWPRDSWVMALEDPEVDLLLGGELD